MQKKYFLTNSMQGVSGKSYLLPSFILSKIFGQIGCMLQYFNVYVWPIFQATEHVDLTSLDVTPVISV